MLAAGGRRGGSRRRSSSHCATSAAPRAASTLANKPALGNMRRAHRSHNMWDTAALYSADGASTNVISPYRACSSHVLLALLGGTGLGRQRWRLRQVRRTASRMRTRGSCERIPMAASAAEDDGSAEQLNEAQDRIDCRRDIDNRCRCRCAGLHRLSPRAVTHLFLFPGSRIKNNKNYSSKLWKLHESRLEKHTPGEAPWRPDGGRVQPSDLACGRRLLLRAVELVRNRNWIPSALSPSRKSSSSSRPTMLPVVSGLKIP